MYRLFSNFIIFAVSNMNSLRIIFMGTPEFAVPSLETLVENGCEVVAVITAPDKPQGRGQTMQPSPIKVAALKHGIPVLQPTNLKAPEFQEELRQNKADLQIVVAFRMLPEAVWSMPKLGTFNLHASLLPQYRGAAPINWAIINGEKETGVTTFFLRHEIDTGSILFQEKEAILPEDDAGALYERLMKKGSQLVLRTVQSINSGNYKPMEQAATTTLKSAPKIIKESCSINFNQSAEQVGNFVRGLSPYPAAWTVIEEKTYKIFRVTPVKASTSDKPWQTDNKNYLYLKTADGWVSVDELQPEGKKRMSVGDFLRGNVIRSQE